MRQTVACIEVVQPDQELYGGWLDVRRDELSPAELAASHDFIANEQPERKAVYEWEATAGPDGLPEPLQAVVGRWAFRFDNTALAKRYVPGEPSGSFDWHTDPEQYEDHEGLTGTLQLATLGGYAIFFAKRLPEDMPVAVALRPNTRVILQGNPPHQVTPPLSKRSFQDFCETRQLDVTPRHRQKGRVAVRTLLFIGRNYSVVTPTLGAPKPPKVATGPLSTS